MIWNASVDWALPIFGAKFPVRNRSILTRVEVGGIFYPFFSHRVWARPMVLRAVDFLSDEPDVLNRSSH